LHLEADVAEKWTLVEAAREAGATEQQHRFLSSGKAAPRDFLTPNPDVPRAFLYRTAGAVHPHGQSPVTRGVLIVIELAFPGPGGMATALRGHVGLLTLRNGHEDVAMPPRNVATEAKIRRATRPTA
jgi:hypothetical protein